MRNEQQTPFRLAKGGYPNLERLAPTRSLRPLEVEGEPGKDYLEEIIVRDRRFLCAYRYSCRLMGWALAATLVLAAAALAATQQIRSNHRGTTLSSWDAPSGAEWLFAIPASNRCLTKAARCPVRIR